MKTQIFAHRGYSGKVMENSMSAFQLARAAGVDGIELDVHLTKDGEIVVIHDETLDRTTNGCGWVQQYTYEEISKFTLKTLPNERIPTLKEVLLLFSNTNTLINIELKNQYVRYNGIAKKVIMVIDDFQMENQVIFSSFHHPSLMELKKLRPNGNIALLIDCVLYEPWNYAKTLGFSQLHLHHSAIDEELMIQCKKQGIVVRTYTVNDKKEMERMITLGVDAIITNYPSKLRSVIEKGEDSMIE